MRPTMYAGAHTRRVCHISGSVSTVLPEYPLQLYGTDHDFDLTLYLEKKENAFREVIPWKDEWKSLQFLPSYNHSESFLKSLHLDSGPYLLEHSRLAEHSEHLLKS